MVEDPLELGDGLGGLLRRKVGLAANVDGIQRAKISVKAETARARSKREAVCSD